MLDSGDTVVEKTDTNPWPHGADILVREKVEKVVK